jgi:NAD-dependent DNA ligase
MASVIVGGQFLARVHKGSNIRKAETYWIGFLSGLAASGVLEKSENFPLLVEAKHFLGLIGDPDANDLVEDLSCSEEFSNAEILTMISSIVEVRMKALIPLSSKDEMNFFLGQCAGVVCDQKVLTAEARRLLETASNLTDLDDHPRIHGFIRFIRNAVRDEHISTDEQADFIAWIESFIGECAADTGIATVESSPNLPFSIASHEEIEMQGASFVVTGAFRLAPRKEIVGQLERLGGLNTQHVTMTTRYVFVASENSRDWKFNQFGGKIQKALQYRVQGIEISFVQEGVLERLLSI